MSSVLKKADKLNLSLSLSLAQVPLYGCPSISTVSLKDMGQMNQDMGHMNG